MSSTEKSSVFYRYEHNLSVVNKGVKHVVKETIIDGEKGVSFLFLEKKGDDFYKIQGKELGNGMFEIKEKKGENEKISEIKEAEVMKLLGSNKKIQFVETYMKKDRKKIQAEKGRVSKKTSKKSGGSKKSSKKVSKKVSKKLGGSKKKASKKVSKKLGGSKKKVTKNCGESKKTSKKTSKK